MERLDELSPFHRFWNYVWIVTPLHRPATAALKNRVLATQPAVSIHFRRFTQAFKRTKLRFLQNKFAFVSPVCLNFRRVLSYFACSLFSPPPLLCRSQDQQCVTLRSERKCQRWAQEGGRSALSIVVATAACVWHKTALSSRHILTNAEEKLSVGGKCPEKSILPSFSRGGEKMVKNNPLSTTGEDKWCIISTPAKRMFAFDAAGISHPAFGNNAAHSGWGQILESPVCQRPVYGWGPEISGSLASPVLYDFFLLHSLK